MRISRCFQVVFLSVFLILFIETEYRGRDEINAAVNAFFRIDPLVLVSTVLAQKAWNLLLLPAFFVLLATMFIGRFFCGWICPLGTILDLLSRKIPRSGVPDWLKGKNYWLLLPMLAAALFGLNISGIFDPIAILVRFLTLALYPLWGVAVRQGWVSLYGIMGEQRDFLAPAYSLVRDNLIPFRDAFYPLAVASSVLFVIILSMERMERRSWCRRLCPLGTLLGFFSRWSLFSRIPATLCPDCSVCSSECAASFDSASVKRHECILCMECTEYCPNARVSFPLRRIASTAEFVPGRRLLLGGMASGLLLNIPFLERVNGRGKTLPLRPPGVRSEKDFLAACIRCGECMKVCLKSALYPASWQAGLEGLATPVVMPRLGYCEYNCTLCGQVCPTGAIPMLPAESKKLEVIGKAVFSKDHCLPFARKMDCIVCEEHCPIPSKAIRSKKTKVVMPDGTERVIHEPYVVEEICNGCGICEFICPVETAAGIRVYPVANRSPISAGTAAETHVSVYPPSNSGAQK